MEQIRQILEEKYRHYNRSAFIETDPICIPHHYTAKEDIEMAGLLTAVIAWGNRKSIISSGHKIMTLMDDSPHAFVMGFSEKDLAPFRSFVHRTFQFDDLSYFLYALKNIYQQHGGMEQVFLDGKHAGHQQAGGTQVRGGQAPSQKAMVRDDGGHGHGRFAVASQKGTMKDAIVHFRKVFFELTPPTRTLKHLSDPSAGSAAKRLNMFLRWMIRHDNNGVDFGLWRSFQPADLYCPLDIHSGTVARRLGLLQRKQNDWKAVEELTSRLRTFDPVDPVRFDFALFGMGVFEKQEINQLIR